MENIRPPYAARPGFGPAPGSGRRPISRAREKLLEILRAQAEPTTLGALARAAALHENTVREHLDALVSDGFATRRAAPPSGRGRPAWLYQATDVEPSSPREYAGLAIALVETIRRRSPSPVEDAVQAGRSWGSDLAQQRDAEPAPSAVAARRNVVDLLDELGFAPEADARAASVRLTRCPLLEAAHRHPDVVCAVHLGLTQGALASYGADSDGVELVPFAEPGACRLRLLARR